jgi:hypothetical protein
MKEGMALLSVIIRTSGLELRLTALRAICVSWNMTQEKLDFHLLCYSSTNKDTFLILCSRKLASLSTWSITVVCLELLFLALTELFTIC